MGVTIVFILSLFAIDLNNPKDIVSVTTLNRLVHPHLFKHALVSNVKKVTELILNINVKYLAAAFSIHLLCIGILVFRWKLLINAQGIYVGFCRLYIYYLIGFFFNNFLPTNIGGDFSRIYNVGKHQNKMTESFASVFMERFIGFIAVFFLAVIAIAFNFQWIKNVSALYSLIVFAVSIGLTIWIIFDARIRIKIKNIIAKIGFMHVNEKLTKFYQSIYLFRESKKLILITLGISFLYQFSLIFVNVFAAKSVGSNPPILPIFFIIQITTLVCVIPVSINGLGVREYLYVQFLSMAGIAAYQIVAFQIVLFMINYMESLAGGFLFLVQKGINKIKSVN